MDGDRCERSHGPGDYHVASQTFKLRVHALQSSAYCCGQGEEAYAAVAAVRAIGEKT